MPPLTGIPFRLFAECDSAIYCIYSLLTVLLSIDTSEGRAPVQPRFQTSDHTDQLRNTTLSSDTCLALSTPRFLASPLPPLQRPHAVTLS